LKKGKKKNPSVSYMGASKRALNTTHCAPKMSPIYDEKSPRKEPCMNWKKTPKKALYIMKRTHEKTTI